MIIGCRPVGVSALALAFGLTALIACRNSPSANSTPCDPPPFVSILPAQISECLIAAGVLSEADRRIADSIIAETITVRDSLLASSTEDAPRLAEDIAGSWDNIADYYDRGLLEDSARFNRVIDQLAASLEYIRGEMLLLDSGYRRYVSPTRPGLVWQYYDGRGIQFTPVTTVQIGIFILPGAWVSTDSLAVLGEALWRYAIWHEAPSSRFPTWEYQFAFTSGNVELVPPWRSGLAQGNALELFAELARRTDLDTWRTRADAVFRSFERSWDDGGVLLADTLHGYWWEEYSPVHRVWNGAAQALIGLTYYAQVTGNREAARMAERGLDGLKHFTPEYDTGSWTLYSRVQGLNTVAYHTLHIQLLDALYELTGDEWCKSTADRWRSYTPPAGVS